MREVVTGRPSVEVKAAATARLEAMGFVNPTSKLDVELRLAPRLKSLRGTRGGLLDNRKGNGDVLLKDISEILLREHGVSGFRSVEKWIYSRPAPEDVIDDLARQCDFVVTAVGD